MPLFIKDLEVSEMAERLASRQHISKTEAVRRALRGELARIADEPSLVDISVAFCRKLRARGDVASGKPADKAFRDSLYEDG